MLQLCHLLFWICAILISTNFSSCVQKSHIGQNDGLCSRNMPISGCPVFLDSWDSKSVTWAITHMSRRSMTKSRFANKSDTSALTILSDQSLVTLHDNRSEKRRQSSLHTWCCLHSRKIPVLNNFLAMEADVLSNVSGTHLCPRRTLEPSRRRYLARAQLPLCCTG
ncbi:hypothetical protein BJ742DRAFT_226703 [Cladochytrium replicatum]|nr:hypothetical protein BJ742DRAFT_226703 [Cladochytrium replicatum]